MRISCSFLAMEHFYRSVSAPRLSFGTPHGAGTWLQPIVWLFACITCSCSGSATMLSGGESHSPGSIFVIVLFVNICRSWQELGPAQSQGSASNARLLHFSGKPRWIICSFDVSYDLDAAVSTISLGFNTFKLIRLEVFFTAIDIKWIKFWDSRIGWRSFLHPFFFTSGSFKSS